MTMAGIAAEEGPIIDVLELQEGEAGEVIPYLESEFIKASPSPMCFPSATSSTTVEHGTRALDRPRASKLTHTSSSLVIHWLQLIGHPVDSHGHSGMG